jgi:hypothetical protein
MSIPAFRYQVGGQGFAVAQPQSMVIPPSTVVDTSLPQWGFLATVAPPIDAIMLTQQTYDYCTSSNGVIGLGYDTARVRVGPGVVSAALDRDVGDYWNKPQHRAPQGAA